MFSDKQIEELNGKLDQRFVAHREQSGFQLSYIEGWHAINEANRIFGFDKWDRETAEMRLVSEKPRKIGRGDNRRDGWSVSYVCKVRIHVGDTFRDGFGTGHGIDADLGQAHESAVKEAETDAMKRALSTFGNKFGLALYDKKQVNVGDPERDKAIELYNSIKHDIEAASSLDELDQVATSEEMQARIAELPQAGAEAICKIITDLESKFKGPEKDQQYWRDEYAAVLKIIKGQSKQDSLEEFMTTERYVELMENLPQKGKDGIVSAINAQSDLLRGSSPFD